MLQAIAFKGFIRHLSILPILKQPSSAKEERFAKKELKIQMEAVNALRVIIVRLTHLTCYQLILASSLKAEAMRHKNLVGLALIKMSQHKQLVKNVQ